MPVPVGVHKLGPENGTLSVRTGRTGAAAKAGHDLVIHVTAWQATLEVGEDPAQTSIALEADSTSLRVREGTGGMQALGDDDKANIEETIDDEVLKRQGIEFRSTAVQIAADGSRIGVQGELTLVGKTCPIAFDLTAGADGTLGGSAIVKQTDWGITPYSALFGALKVVDEVEVVLDATYGRVDPGYVAEAREAPDLRETGSRPRRFRPPRIPQAVASVLWALGFFLYLWLGMVAVGGSHSTALPLALVGAFLIYALVRTRGGPREDS